VIGQLVASIGLLAVNGFFVAVEFALVGSHRARLEPMAESGGRRARVALRSISELNLQLAGAQLGITIASLLLGYVAEPLVVHLFEGVFDQILPDGVSHALAFAAGLSIVVFAHLVFGEMVPKNVALAAPERTLLVLALPNQLYVVVFKPVIRLLNVMATGIARLLGVEPRDELGGSHTVIELSAMVAESHGEGLIEDRAHDLLAGVLDFGGRTVAEVLVPRAQMVTIDRQTTAAEAAALAGSAGLSRLPLVGATVDEPYGFVHAKDLLALPVEALGQPVPLRLVRQLLVVRVGRELDDVLRDMRRSRTHLALAMDEGGRTAGIVSLEDLLEELVGNILDETDRDD